MAEVSEFDNTNELEEVNCEYTRRKTINQVNETLIFKNTFEEKKKSKNCNQERIETNIAHSIGKSDNPEVYRIPTKLQKTKMKSINYTFKPLLIDASPNSKTKAIRKMSSRKILSFINAWEQALNS